MCVEIYQDLLPCNRREMVYNNYMRYPTDDNYVAGWEWASGKLADGCSVKELKQLATSVAYDISGSDETAEIEIVYEGIIDRLES